ncbi:cation acetate symporter [Streptomyces cyaneochromogenes]|uniref:Cation acetate symporter n=1 Tax=Streptomyces cyaneochromogenes TaxID=2496836 RepID=A0A3Q9EUH1_9ACTN|nr:cation acetate symporter [Streptomyces cyaneochromogenes]AZQ36279.1 cation acetate symporter [Streptomyces cyaneochromogenes]
MSLALELMAAPSFHVFTVFAPFVCCALFLAVLVISGDGTDGADGGFYLGDRRLSPARAGLALFGSYMSAATLLGTPGLVALTGYDGMMIFLLGPVVSWIVIQFLIAEPYHSTGRFTVGDCLARRLNPRPVHAAAGLATLVICLLYLIPQLVGAGALAAPVLGLTGVAAERSMVAALGFVMILYVAIGGMRATTVVQLLKAGLLVGGGLLLAFGVLSEAGWNPGEVLHRAAVNSGAGDRFLNPGAAVGSDAVSRVDGLSLQLAIVLGAAGLPHLLMRISAVPTARAARGTVRWAALLTLAFCLLAAVIGLGAGALVGPARITRESPSGNTATFLLADQLGGTVLLTVISCVAFMTILAVVSGTTLAACAAVAHDLYQAAFRQGRAPESREVGFARIAAVLIGVIATALSMYAQDINVTTLVALAFAVAASTVLPALLYTLYWSGFTSRGACWTLYGGLVSSLTLWALSPGLSGSPTSLLPNSDFALFPLRYCGIASIPLGFLLGWLGSFLDHRQPDVRKFADLQHRVAVENSTGISRTGPGVARTTPGDPGSFFTAR